MTTIETEVLIPGNFVAKILHGRIVGYTFIPHAANAGYFGDEIIVTQGDTSLTSNEFFDMVSSTLMFDQSMTSAHVSCEWES